jgi:anti-sigma B factor antagonist
VYEETDRTWAGSSIRHDDSKLTIDEHLIGDVTVLALSGKMLLDDGEIAFRTLVHELLLKGRLKFVIDFDGVAHIDSSGVGMLVAKLQTIRKTGGDIRLIHLAPRHQRLLTTMRVLPLFKVFDDEAAAIESFAEPLH